ncbi:MAG TPA: hypothetical protein PLX18_05405 [Anaerohalosphaeraceae bacterium]|nr:hypothetical protein [Anaerohalosphaeraceae bacterium]HQG05996.1 hypothetical protein [Anaerohalosphaeraceae bacterium]HQI07278.1 hypothetical protein [Anaerohalosphaeraceae bacterium]HQJ67277.1 hypothetical protein [Anaerohalosphaeraceae bacterium]
MDFVGMLFLKKNGMKGVLWVFGLEMGFLGKFAHRGAQAARILKPLKNGRAHFKAGFWTCGGVGAHF